jgi:putative glutamine amidotransferase
MIGAHPFHAVGEKYIYAIEKAANALPLLIPVLPEPLSGDELLSQLDGILFTGSPSNVDPQHYGGEASDAGTLHDPHRDATTLPLIPAAVAAGVPVLGLCRGFQEMNVSFGGTLWQQLQQQPGHLDHRERKDDPLDAQYAPAHEVILEPGGMLTGLAGGVGRLRVNSLHSQGVRRLGESLLVEARATDGVIEAFRVRASRSFALAVQWHPEWQVMANDFSRAIFAAFGDAARERARARK